MALTREKAVHVGYKYIGRRDLLVIIYDRYESGAKDVIVLVACDGKVVDVGNYVAYAINLGHKLQEEGGNWVLRNINPGYNVNEYINEAWDAAVQEVGLPTETHVELSFLVSGHCEQTVILTEEGKKISPTDLIAGLNEGTIVTTVQDGGQVIGFAKDEDEHDRTLAQVESNNVECSYEEFEEKSRYNYRYPSGVEEIN